MGKVIKLCISRWPRLAIHNFQELEDLMVLKRSPDLLNNVKIGQDQLRLIMKHISFYGGCSHFCRVA